MSLDISNAPRLKRPTSPFFVRKPSGNTTTETPSLNISDLAKVKIAIPPLEEQKSIVSILDRFDTLCNDLSAGLPAEIAARQQQYEYYRDKLLTFKELT